jgi:hypothetical protein
MHHIKTTLPDIKQKISQSLTKYENELASLGGAAGGTDGVRSTFLCLNSVVNLTNEDLVRLVERHPSNHHRILR